jgi:polar amino acid transport system substrate-binding protein
MHLGHRSTFLSLGVAVLVTVAGCSSGTASPSTAATPAATSAGSAAAPGSADPSAATNPALEKLKTVGLRVSFVNENPWSYVNDAGDFTGAEAELVKDCGSRLGFQVLPILTQWDAQLPGLASDRWDAIVAGMATTPARLEVAISTQPLYAYGARLLVQKGNPLNLHNWDDVAKSGETVGMVSGGFYQKTVEAKGIKVVAYDSLDAEILDLLAGRIKIVANAETSLSQYVSTNADKPVEVADPWDYQGIGISYPSWYFQTGNEATRDLINDCISEQKQDGKMKAILDQFGFNSGSIAPVGPGEPPIADIIPK